ncbi:MAG: hypothetical protein JWP29_2355 [Rhodoferax sp.]|nr:hypothetical protein [Rhodoferax sp.]
MLWNKVSLRSSLQSLNSLLSSKNANPPKSAKADPRRIEQVRSVMRRALDEAGVAGFEHVAKRLEQAKDIEALWFLRADLMGALSTIQGETAARRAMAKVTPLFDGLLPASLNSRPSPLDGA